MKLTEFLKNTLLASVLSVLAFYLLNAMLELGTHDTLLWWSLTLFIALAALVFWIADFSIKLNNGAQFIGLVIFNVFIKLVASFALVAYYVKLYQPQEKIFIIPFLITYLIFTVLETYFLSVQAREVR